MQPENNTFLLVSTVQSSFLFPLEDVQEVSEMLPIRPYPVDFKNHFGIINLRGQVVPVISIFNLEKKVFYPNGRLVITQTGGYLVAFTCQSVKKVVLTENQFSELESHELTNIDGQPVILLSMKHILSQGAA